MTTYRGQNSYQCISSFIKRLQNTDSFERTLGYRMELRNVCVTGFVNTSSVKYFNTTHDSNSYTNDVTFQANFTSPNIHTNENSHTSKNDTELFVSLENKKLTY